LLHERLPWVTTSLYPTASERSECMLAMLFWVLLALAVVGALAIVWGLYLLVHRWL
jgi:nitrate reductase NapE component